MPSSSWAWVPSFVAALRNPQSTVSKTRKSVMFCWRWEGGCYWGRALRKRYARLCAYVNIPARAAAGRSWAARRTAWACFVLFKRGGGGDVLLCAARCVAESSNIKQVVRIVIGANIQAENEAVASATIVRRCLIELQSCVSLSPRATATTTLLLVVTGKESQNNSHLR